MSREIGARAQLALLFFTTLNIAAFTAIVYVAMLSPELLNDAGYWIVGGMLASVLITAPLSWALAPYITEKWRKRLLARPSPLARVSSGPF